MTKNVNEILVQISSLEEELRQAMSVKVISLPRAEASGRLTKRLSVPRTDGARRSSLFEWTRFRNVLAAPVIYTLIVPMILLDFTVTIYQAICFPLFEIPKSRRSDFISIGRHRLSFLNIVEKIHCGYCEYINGLLAFVSDVASKTEQYFCPIKYANKVIAAHARYDSFQEYGDNINFHESLKAYRRALRDHATEPAQRSQFDERIDN